MMSEDACTASCSQSVQISPVWCCQASSCLLQAIHLKEQLEQAQLGVKAKEQELSEQLAQAGRHAEAQLAAAVASKDAVQQQLQVEHSCCLHTLLSSAWCSRIWRKVCRPSHHRWLAFNCRGPPVCSLGLCRSCRRRRSRRWQQQLRLLLCRVTRPTFCGNLLSLSSTRSAASQQLC